MYYISTLFALVVQSQSHVRLCHPMDCSMPGSSVCGISQARTLEWVAISFCMKTCTFQFKYFLFNTSFFLFHLWMCLLFNIFSFLLQEYQLHTLAFFGLTFISVFCTVFLIYFIIIHGFINFPQAYQPGVPFTHVYLVCHLDLNFALIF